MYWVGLLGIVALVVYTVVANLYLHVSDKQCIVGIGNSVRYGMACPLLSGRLGLLSQLVWLQVVSTQTSHRIGKGTIKVQNV